MRYLIDVWFKPWMELSAIDELVMGTEAIAALVAIAFIKVYVVDRLRGVRYYRG